MCMNSAEKLQQHCLLSSPAHVIIVCLLFSPSLFAIHLSVPGQTKVSASPVFWIMSYLHRATAFRNLLGISLEHRNKRQSLQALEETLVVLTFAVAHTNETIRQS
ncbi:hypothetical protein BDV10DRAFT_117861 [Aspergillus recurvatus]